MEKRLPNHLGIIMDGNGRWAKNRSLPIAVGHKAGYDTMNKIVEIVNQLGIKHLTVYGFSTENIKRSSTEVNALFNIIKKGFVDSKKKAMTHDVRYNTIGEPKIFPEALQKLIKELEEETKDNTGLFFHLALNYGGRDEIIRAVKRMNEDSAESGFDIGGITEKSFENYLDTAGVPDVDLVIRTSGEHRTSNFMIWQAAYAELYFTDKLWPDFDKEELMKALEFYASRERRFGGRL